jgi:hypothetical protein
MLAGVPSANKVIHPPSAELSATLLLLEGAVGGMAFFARLLFGFGSEPIPSYARPKIARRCGAGLRQLKARHLLLWSPKDALSRARRRHR